VIDNSIGDRVLPCPSEAAWEVVELEWFIAKAGLLGSHEAPAVDRRRASLPTAGGAHEI